MTLQAWRNTPGEIFPDWLKGKVTGTTGSRLVVFDGEAHVVVLPGEFVIWLPMRTRRRVTDRVVVVAPVPYGMREGVADVSAYRRPERETRRRR